MDGYDYSGGATPWPMEAVDPQALAARAERDAARRPKKLPRRAGAVRDPRGDARVNDLLVAQILVRAVQASPWNAAIFTKGNGVTTVYKRRSDKQWHLLWTRLSTTTDDDGVVTHHQSTERNVVCTWDDLDERLRNAQMSSAALIWTPLSPLNEDPFEETPAVLHRQTKAG